jgi:hypothetical protein
MCHYNVSEYVWWNIFVLRENDGKYMLYGNRILKYRTLVSRLLSRATKRENGLGSNENKIDDESSWGLDQVHRMYGTSFTIYIYMSRS